MQPMVRPAEEGDADAVWAILAPIFREGETYCVPRDIDRAAALDYWSGGNHRSFVAEAGASILGTCFLCPNQRGGGDHVANAGFATAEAARGQGVARIMLDHVLAEARATGFRAMQFNFVVATNTGAIRLWQAAGFATVGRLPEAFRHPRAGYVDALVMYRRL
jgi:ribosomal protein S18 acetylase RimI-like enzyme